MKEDSVIKIIRKCYEYILKNSSRSSTNLPSALRANFIFGLQIFRTNLNKSAFIFPSIISMNDWQYDALKRKYS